jgi:non-heme chloroperoxidase
MPRPVVMIHGAFVGGWYFRWLKPYFTERGHVCYAPDLRHHDHDRRAPPELASVGLADYRADLIELIDSLDEQPIIIGHSMGGLLAQQLAAEDRAAALVLLAPSAPWGILPGSVSEIGAAYQLLHQGDYWNRILLPDRNIAAAVALDRVRPDVREAALELMRPESGLAVFQTIHWGMDVAMASAVDHRKVTCPVLCIAGKADQIVSPGTVRSVANKYRKVSTYEEIGWLSHFIAGEEAAAPLPSMILSWLDEVM